MADSNEGTRRVNSIKHRDTGSESQSVRAFVVTSIGWGSSSCFAGNDKYRWCNLNHDSLRLFETPEIISPGQSRGHFYSSFNAKA